MEGNILASVLRIKAEVDWMLEDGIEWDGTRWMLGGGEVLLMREEEEEREDYSWMTDNNEEAESVNGGILSGSVNGDVLFDTETESAGKDESVGDEAVPVSVRIGDDLENGPGAGGDLENEPGAVDDSGNESVRGEVRRAAAKEGKEKVRGTGNKGNKVVFTNKKKIRRGEKRK